MFYLFWLCFFLITFHYIIFGALVILASKLKTKQHKIDPDFCPSVSFIVAAYNEEKVIEAKILNDLELDYPKEKIELIIVSDGSNDSTPALVGKYKDAGVIGLHKDERQGKIAALNRAVSFAKHDILVFSDANSFFNQNAIKKLVRHFVDPKIGGVCGRKAILNNEKRIASKGDELYWRYESALKQAESKLGSIPTADGEIFAMRKSLYKEIDRSVINDDTAITLSIIKENQRVIYDQEAITYEEASLSFKDDFNVKARMVYGGIQMLSQYKKELSPFLSWFGTQFFFHKTLRYFMWSLLVLIYFSNIALVGEGLFYKVFFCLQTSFYFLAFVGAFQDKISGKMPTIIYLPYYYCNVNIAALRGFLFYLKQKSLVDIWTKAKR